MSVVPLTPRGAEAGKLASFPLPEYPEECQPPSSKRPRLEGTREVSQSRWKLPLVPRLSEGEKVWELSPRPFCPLLVSADELFSRPRESSLEKSVHGEQKCPPGCPECRFPSSGVGSGASRKFAAGLEVRVGCGDSEGVWPEAVQPVPRAPSPHSYEVKPQDGNQERGNRQRDDRYIKATESPFLDLSLSKVRTSASREMNNTCQARAVRPSGEKEKNISAPTLKTARPQNQRGLERAKPSSFPEGSTICHPEFSTTDFNGSTAPVLVKQTADTARDIPGACVRGFTDSRCSPDRTDAEGLRLLGAEGIVAAGEVFPECHEMNGSHPGSLSKRNTWVTRRKALMGLKYLSHSTSVGSDVSDGGKRSTRFQVEAEGGEETPQGQGCHVRVTSRKTREDGGIGCDFQVKCENVKEAGEKWSRRRQLAVDLQREVGNQSVPEAVTMQRAQWTFLRMETPGDQSALISACGDSGREGNVRLLRGCAEPKGFRLSSLFESFLTDGFELYYSSRSGQLEHDTLTRCEILIWDTQGVVQNKLKMEMIFRREERGVNVNRKSDTSCLCLQTTVSELLKVTLKSNRASLLSGSASSVVNDSNSGERCASKRTVCLNYSKETTGENTVHVVRALTFSELLGGDITLKSEKRDFLIDEQVFEGPKNRNLSLFSMTMKYQYFPSFETYDRIPLPKEFDDVGEISMTGEVGCENSSCPQKLATVENGAQCSLNTAETYAKPSSQCRQSNYICVNERVYEISICIQSLDTRSKQPSTIKNFNFQGIVDEIFNTGQQAKMTNHDIGHSGCMTSKSINRGLNFRNLISEIEGKEHDLILKEEVEVTEQNVTNSYHAHKETKLGKQEGNSLYPVLVTSQKGCVEEMNRHVHQNSVAEENESFLQESELANSKYSHPKNDSSESVNHQFETNFSAANQECFQDLTAKCLSTEALTMVKDFEMKSKFDLVLEELRMFHEISREEEIVNTVEANQRSENNLGENKDTEEVQVKIKRDLKVGPVNPVCASSLSCDATASPNIHRRHQSLFKWETVPQNEEQDIPNKYYCPRTSDGGLLYYTKEDCEKPLPQRPTYYAEEHNEEKLNYVLKGGSTFSHGISRVLPLKTCSRPIRIGLSRKAKLKQLHPYLK